MPPMRTWTSEWKDEAMKGETRNYGTRWQAKELGLHLEGNGIYQKIVRKKNKRFLFMLVKGTSVQVPGVAQRPSEGG